MVRRRLPLIALVLLVAIDGLGAPSGPSYAPSVDDPPALDGPPLATDLTRPGTAATPTRACSLESPVCVHGARDVPDSAMIATLAALERARARLVDVLALPAPLTDGSRGGGPEIDLYIVDGEAAPQTGRDAPLPWTLDRASAFIVISSPPERGCVLEHIVATSVAEAIEIGIDAGEQPSMRKAIAEHLADVIAPCDDIALARLDDAQLHPERAVTPLLPAYLDVALSATSAGSLPIALATLASQKSPTGSPRWHNEPDLFDALRANLGARVPKVDVGDLLLELSIARAFMGSRDDGRHLLGDGFAGTFGRVRFDASIPFESLPRRVVPRAPLEPTGAAFVWIDVRNAPKGARVAFRAEWESPAAFRWAAVRVRKDGTEASRVLVTPQQNATSAERNVEAVDGLSGVAIIGVNVGDLGLVHPFDPDELPYEPHGYTLTIATE